MEKTTKACEVALSYKTKVKAGDRAKIACSSDTVDILRSTVFNEDTIEHHESFYVMLLNRANRVLGFHKVSDGGIAETAIDVRIVMQAAILANASGIILSHNHPSGNLQPSKQDIAITEKIKRGGELFDITVLDHIVVTADSYYSFADNGNI